MNLLLGVVTTVGTAYNGVRRLDFYFDDPNKLAVLFCFLVLICLGVAFRIRRWIYAVPLYVVALAAGGGLCLTYSRGGLVACAVGLGSLLLERRVTGWWRTRGVVFMGTLVVWIGLAVFTGAAGRLVQSSVQDGSIANRLMYWKAVPQMVADARHGWGLGEAGCAFMSWYQPLDRGEEIRTLVGSHWTWLVEFGDGGRLLYCLAWLLVLGICLEHLRRKNDAIPLALWSSLALAAAFSSVAEAWELWCLPVAFLGWPVMMFFCHGGISRFWKILKIGPWSVCFCWGLSYAGRLMSSTENVPVRAVRFGGRIVYGQEGGRQRGWIVRDLRTLGGGAYGHALRSWWEKAPGVYGIARSLADVPPTVEHLALCGDLSLDDVEAFKRFPLLKHVRILLPTSRELPPLPENLDVVAYYGEFAANCPRQETAHQKILDGVKDVLVDWPAVAFGR